MWHSSRKELFEEFIHRLHTIQNAFIADSTRYIRCNSFFFTTHKTQHTTKQTNTKQIATSKHKTQMQIAKKKKKKKKKRDWDWLFDWLIDLFGCLLFFLLLRWRFCVIYVVLFMLSNAYILASIYWFVYLSINAINQSMQSINAINQSINAMQSINQSINLWNQSMQSIYISSCWTPKQKHTHTHKLKNQQGLCFVVPYIEGKDNVNEALCNLFNPMGDIIHTANTKLQTNNWTDFTSTSEMKAMRSHLLGNLDLVSHAYRAFMNVKAKGEDIDDVIESLIGVSKRLSPLLVSLLRLCSVSN